MKVYGDKGNFRVQKALVAAQVSNKTVELAAPTTLPAASYPLGILPALEDSNTRLFGEDAIAQYLAGANSTYYPQNPEVQQWLAYGNQVLWSAVRDYLLPSVSAAKVDSATVEVAKKELLAVLKSLNSALVTRTYLVGNSLTVADVSVALNLVDAYKYVLDAAARKDIVNVTRWFQTVVNQTAVKQVVGEVVLCESVSQFDEATHAKLVAASAPAPKAEKPKAEKKPKVEEEPEDDTPVAPKFVDPFQAMPAGTFVLDAFKRSYSNEDTLTKAIPHFWENFDAEANSIWYAEYKYPEELTLTFMSCNLISGMFQRLEKLKKHGFASVCLFGTDNNSTISGIWLWRGQELAFELSPDWQVDYESYTWKKLDAKDEATKKLVNEYLLWEGDFGGKKFNQGKIFK